MSERKKVYVVPHSHWDREWYFTIEDSNLLLTENMDYLIQLLEIDESFHAYMFDGQMSIVDDYLKIRPENRERLKKLIQAKKLFVGPWYTQADSLLVNKESLIRNLLYGTRMASSFGHSMSIGYLPDIFGQNAYLPSIFKDFGIEYSILQRGIYQDELGDDLNFQWQSPDGTRIKSNYIYLGYGPGKFLSSDDEYVTERLKPMLEKLGKLNKSTGHLLLPAGGDQVLARSHFPETIKALNEMDADHEYILSDYETYMEEAWKEEFPAVLEGELLAPQKSRIHNTIRSQRYDIKYLNNEAESKILHILEPLAAIGYSLGLNYPQSWLDHMWKQLFDVHAHDSIGGCNSDQTNSDIISRLHKVIRLADGQANLIKKQITHAVSSKLGEKNIFVLFNLLPKQKEQMGQAVLFTKKPAFTITKAGESETAFEILEQEYISGGKQVVVTADGDKEIELEGYYRSTVSLQAGSLPSMGYQTFIVSEKDGESEDRQETSSLSCIENSALKLCFENGNVTLFNKLTKQTAEQLISFENTADDGDSYDYSPLEGDQPMYLSNAKLLYAKPGKFVQELAVEHERALPANLDERKKKQATGSMKIVTVFELHQGEDFLRVKHEIENTLEDQRTRVLLKAPMKDLSKSYADQGFTLLERSSENPRMENWREEGYAEAPVPIYPLETAAALKEGQNVFAVSCKGMKEYEVLTETKELALTLFRSVGLLGKDNLAWRPGRASGINNKIVETPDAQMKQKMVFEYAVQLKQTEQLEDAIFAFSESFQNHQTAYQLQSLNTFEERLDRFEIPYPVKEAPQVYSLFSIDDGVYFSMCKLAWEQDGLILRVCNPSEEEAETVISSDRNLSFKEANLYEKEGGEISGRTAVTSRGYKTIKISMKKGDDIL
ncbi:alpha-mannosidase [Metabacillus sp. GX 13764]|uniref:glycoside hydrolase family 38 N-terminal domain-containing protein n=1 Tax=Metabacillus kandeliae TaxID=2900151 RepID=UPI001E3E3A64|nr:glycoside hydrolase family 38 C-terminal domain-containing protein [Metabacillus kandeliae]MCD7035688.1 alpha-mannosidase [Metabacillus kandeliae]